MLLIKFQVIAANLRAAASCYKALLEKKTKNFSMKRDKKGNEMFFHLIGPLLFTKTYKKKNQVHIML